MASNLYLKNYMTDRDTLLKIANQWITPKCVKTDVFPTDKFVSKIAKPTVIFAKETSSLVSMVMTKIV